MPSNVSKPGLAADELSSSARRKGWAVGWVERLFLLSIGTLLLLQFSPEMGRAKVAATIAASIFGVIALARLGLFALRQAIWHIRDRLIVTYIFVAVVPIVLLAIFAEAGAWVLSSQIGTYLLNAEMERRTANLRTAAQALSRVPPAERAEAIRRSGFIFNDRYPGIEILIRDPNGAETRYPPESAVTAPRGDFGDRAGIVVKDGHFHLWAHAGGPRSEVVFLVPVTRNFLRGLVPSLGDVTLRSFLMPVRGGEGQAVRIHPPIRGDVPAPGADVIPPAANFLDLTILYGVTLPVSIWDNPSAQESAVLGMRTRISGVLNLLFNQQAWREQTSLLEVLVVVAVIFVIVEILAAIVGISLTRAIARSVMSLYEGTERVKEGDLSHRIQVEGQDQLAELGRSFNAMTTNLERLLRMEKDRQRMQAELEIAREVQAQLHPKEIPALGSLRLASVCNAARMVSGDYYDYQRIGDHHLALAIGDVAGKGISAALLMATLQSAMRSQLRHQVELCRQPSNGHDGIDISTSKLVENINQHLYTSTSPEKYATFFFSVFDDSNGELTYTNAGHLPPFLIRRGEAIALDSNGTVVGAFPHVRYDQSRITLESGDLLVCYTDGITEPENEYGEMFGEERLVEVLRANASREASEVAAAVVDAVQNWTTSGELQDDVTLVVARKL